MGGLGKLSDLSRATIFEVARMSYGKREGVKGGRGHIGMLNPEGDGPIRIVKFDTHGGTSTEDAARRSSNDLRQMLMKIAAEAKLPDDVLVDVRQLLGLPEDETGDQRPMRLLDRSIAAQVVEKIAGKRVWSLSHAKDREANGYVSSRRAMFSRVIADAGNAGNTSNVRAVDVHDARNLNVRAPEGRTDDEGELAMFGSFANEHQNAADFYVRFTPNGLNLESAGSYAPIRSLKAKRDNNYVRQRLWDCVNDYFRGKIPVSVKDVLPSCDGKGKPVSASCIAQVMREVFEADHIPNVIRTVKQIQASGNPPTADHVVAFMNRLGALYPGISDTVKKQAALSFAFALCRASNRVELLPRLIGPLELSEDNRHVKEWEAQMMKISSNSAIYRDVLDFLYKRNPSNMPTVEEIDTYCLERYTDEQHQGLSRKQTFVLMLVFAWDQFNNRGDDLGTSDFFEHFQIDPEYAGNIRQEVINGRHEGEVFSIDGKMGFVVGAGFDDLPVINKLKNALFKIKEKVRSGEGESVGVNEQHPFYHMLKRGDDILSVMLPEALELVRVFQPDAELTVQALWTVLQLEGKCPNDLTTDEGALAFCKALYQRIRSDFPEYAKDPHPEKMWKLFDKIANTPLKYEALRVVLNDHVLPKRTHFRQEWHPVKHSDHSLIATEWKNAAANRDKVRGVNILHWNEDRVNKFHIPVKFTLDKKVIHTVGPREKYKFADIPEKFEQEKLTKEQAIVLSSLFLDYDSQLMESLQPEISLNTDEGQSVHIEVMTDQDDQDRKRVCVNVPYRTSEGTGVFVHEYAIDKNGYLHSLAFRTEKVKAQQEEP